MNCDRFLERMHQRLDRRESLDADGELCQHARQCESCRAQLDAWRQIALVIPTPTACQQETTPQQHSLTALVPLVAGVAAALLLVAVPLWFTPSSDKLSVEKVMESSDGDGVVDVGAREPNETQLAPANGDLDPVHWWRTVQNRDWLGQTMPTVKSVQEGVAPIGRSLMRAVTILTMGAPDQTS